MPKHDASHDGEALTKVNGGWLTADRHVTVLQEDIDHGKQRDQWGCAIVRAIQRANPRALRVRVNAKLIGFTIDEIRYTFPTPPEAVEAIIKPFDRNEEVVPTTLRLRGGKMKDALHATDSLRQTKREYQRNKPETPVSSRMAQMSPTYKEYERFGKDK